MSDKSDKSEGQTGEQTSHSVDQSNRDILRLSFLQSKNELKDLRSYSKIKEGQVKALSDTLAVREREIGQLQEQIDALDLRRKTAILELLDVSSVVNEKQKKINVLKERFRTSNESVAGEIQEGEERVGEHWEDERRGLLFEVQTLSQECNTFKTNLQLIKQQKETLLAEINELNTKNFTVESDLKLLQEQNSILSFNTVWLTTELKAERERKDSLISVINKLEKTLPDVTRNEVLEWKVKYYESENRQINDSLSRHLSSLQPPRNNISQPNTYHNTSSISTLLQPSNYTTEVHTMDHVKNEVEKENILLKSEPTLPSPINVPHLGKEREKEDDKLVVPLEGLYYNKEKKKGDDTLMKLEENSKKESEEADRALRELEETRREMECDHINFSPGLLPTPRAPLSPRPLSSDTLFVRPSHPLSLRTQSPLSSHLSFPLSSSPPLTNSKDKNNVSSDTTHYTSNSEGVDAISANVSMLISLEKESERKRQEADRALKELDELRKQILKEQQRVSDKFIAANKSANDENTSSHQLELSMTHHHSTGVMKLTSLQIESTSSSFSSHELTQDNSPQVDSFDLQIHNEIQEAAQWVRDQSRRPTTAEVEADSDEESTLPYDPNLICPKCGKRYHIGGIQLFKRHVTELCPLLEKD